MRGSNIKYLRIPDEVQLDWTQFLMTVSQLTSEMILIYTVQQTLLHLYIRVDILYTIPHTFPMIIWMIKNFLSRWLFPYSCDLNVWFSGNIVWRNKIMVTLKVKLKWNQVANYQTWYLLCGASLCFRVTHVSFFVNTSKVIDMVKDEMVKQGKSRGTGRPGKVTWIVETERIVFCYSI